MDSFNESELCLFGRCSERYWFSVAAHSGCWLFFIFCAAAVGISGRGWLIIEMLLLVVAVEADEGGGLANAEPAPVSWYS